MTETRICETCGTPFVPAPELPPSQSAGMPEHLGVQTEMTVRRPGVHHRRRPGRGRRRGPGRARGAPP